MFYFYAPTLWKPITHLHTPFSGGIDRSSPPEVFLGKRLLEICSKFAEHPRRSVISMRLFCNFIEIALWNRNFPVNLLHIFIAPFSKNTSDGLTQHNNGALGESGLKICLDNLSSLWRMMRRGWNNISNSIFIDSVMVTKKAV